MKLLFYLAVFLLFNFGQKFSSEKSSNIETSIEIYSNSPKFTKIIQGQHSNILKPQNIVINNQLDLIDLFDKINATNSNEYKIPEIDFSKEQVIGLFMENQTVEGYQIRISNVILNEDETIILDPRATAKDRSEMLSTHPFYIATIQKTEKSIKFIKTNC